MALLRRRSRRDEVRRDRSDQPSNVASLQTAWTWRTGEQARPNLNVGPGAFEVTPILIDDVLYLSTPFNRVVALDAKTGQPVDSFGTHGIVDVGDTRFGQPTAASIARQGQLAFRLASN